MNDAILTDEQCDEFRRLPCSFNNMVRAIYIAGRGSAMEPIPAQDLAMRIAVALEDAKSGPRICLAEPFFSAGIIHDVLLGLAKASPTENP